MSHPRATELLRQAIAIAKAGDKPKARTLLVEAASLDPKNELVWLWRASVSEEPIDALKSLEAVLNINPNNDHARQAIRATRLNAGVAAARQGQKEQAQVWLRQACTDDPGNENAWMWLAGVTENPIEAMGHLEQVLRINPSNERAKTGVEFYRTRLKPAQPQWYCPICLTKSESRFVICPTCHTVLSLANLDEAINNPKADFARLKDGVNRLSNHVRTKPDFASYYYLGMAMLNMHQIPEAINYFKAAQRINPDNDAFATHLLYLEQKTAAAAPPPVITTRRAGSVVITPQQQALNAETVNFTAQPPAVNRMQQPVPQMVQPVANNKARKCVLVVDDSPTIRKLVSMTMAKSGYRVMEAGDGNEAVDRMQAEGNPDLVLLDVTMPGMDGYTLCKLIRGNQETAKIPVIMLSGKDGFFNKIRGKMAGSTLYLTKPFQPDALVRVVQKYCPVDATPVSNAS